jgi:hypothetical protein
VTVQCNKSTQILAYADDIVTVGRSLEVHRRRQLRN